MVHLQQFSGKHENERVLFFSHAHILVLIQKLLLPFVSLIFISILFVMFLQYNITFFPADVFFVIIILWQIFEIFARTYCYYSTFFVITDRRIYAKKKKRLFTDTFAESIELSGIKSTEAKHYSFLQFLFHFGDIHIGASGTPLFTFTNLPHPEDVSLYLDKVVSLLVRKQMTPEQIPVFTYSKKEYLESQKTGSERLAIQQKVKNVLGK